MTQEIIADWQDRHRDLFGKHTIKLTHRLAETGLFSMQAIAELIDAYPEDLYNVTTMGRDHTRKQWREGAVAGKTGAEVIEAVSKGRIWINLRRVMDVDPRYDRLMKDIFAAFESRVPGLKTYRQNLGILVSSPNAQVYYHADIPGQSLWQIAGRKRVYVYPNTEPFLRAADMESIVMGLQEEEIDYEPWFDEYAEVYDIGPGEMLHWGLNCPHRVVNADCVNVSVTTEHWTDSIRNAYAVHYGNGILRTRLGMAPRRHDLQGPSVYAKAGLALAWKKLRLNRKDAFVRKIDFHVDPNAPEGFEDVTPYVK